MRFTLRPLFLFVPAFALPTPAQAAVNGVTIFDAALVGSSMYSPVRSVTVP